jgi:hypothetical protein
MMSKPHQGVRTQITTKVRSKSRQRIKPKITAVIKLASLRRRFDIASSVAKTHTDTSIKRLCLLKNEEHYEHPKSNR